MQRRSARWIAVALLASISICGCTFKPIVNPPFALTSDPTERRDDPGASSQDSLGASGAAQAPRAGVGISFTAVPPAGHGVETSPDAGASPCPSGSDAGAPCGSWTVEDGASSTPSSSGGADAGTPDDEPDEPDGETPE
jgi:hypothetical protein